MSRNQRNALLGLAVVVLVVGVGIAQSGGGRDTSGSGKTIEIKDAKRVGGIQVLKFNKGGTIRFKVHSHTADEIHFHGYDKHQDVAKGGTGWFDVPATI